MTELHLAAAFSDPGNGMMSQQTHSKVSQVTQLTSPEFRAVKVNAIIICQCKFLLTHANFL